MEATRGSISKLPVYAALGIPEVWRLDRGRIVVLHRAGPDRYEPAERSRAFPDLDMNRLNEFLALARQTSQHQAAKALRDWVRSV